MLSRVANSLYWMVRYIERADNLARLIEVNEQLILDLERVDRVRLEGFWRPIILSTGDDELFQELFPNGSTQDVVRYLTEERRNPNSIASCVALARENARMVRDQLSEALWEELNSLYLFVNSGDSARLLAMNPAHYYETIRRATYSFHGIAASTTVRDEAWEFMDLGRHIERADKTTRFLDITSFLPADAGDAPVPIDYHWTAILRSCGGLGAFRVKYRGDLTPRNVAEFLIYARDFPRSVRFCVDRIDANLHNISGSPRGTYANDAERCSGRLLSELAYGSVEEVVDSGLHEFLDAIQTQFNEIGEEMFKAYVLLPDQIDERPPIPAATVSAVVAWQMAQQQQ